ncbi:4'-phosphopantetheinyl transferase superfamily protein [Corynebacterium breve]|uniref:4'-phosphopantetheinyl transferase superfamily protein n=1 Tax=Corynebacterium breve TaxID=3049799 RepID=A0ABY8VEZ6_9CORY|nr:4'-phosphopantetheinyl transferase superfamily protein [Corynebacterium breve]WIM66828.1 4'-phosphopantetheinyl transferase superfamily protein [Corynebacterium breve]
MQDEELFPSAARYVYILSEPKGVDLTNYHELDPLEQLLVSQSVDRRKAEFGDARWCAHRALHELGADNRGPILRGERGMPLWPEGFTGSLTHTKGFRAAVAAPKSKVLALGVDAEPAEPLPEGVLEQIARRGELSQLHKLRAAGIKGADRLLFCAKEAVYKAWFPMTHRWLGFEDAEIDLRLDGTLVAYLLVRPTPLPFIEGRWRVRGNYVIVSTAIKA